MSVDLKKIAAAFPEFQLSSKSRHDGALLLQLQAADGRYVARTIPSPQLSAPPETEWLIRSIRRELAVPGMEMAMAARRVFSPREPMMR
ncbi:DUF3509 domain-containing protein [Pseudomonas aeruginosa]|uniref:DUF3509 domain-containing protein n=1 Tax=Pseudomonas aeruginosa TaxID=287 RepID=UPI003F521482